jgi:hypothetical protein
LPTNPAAGDSNTPVQNANAANPAAQTSAAPASLSSAVSSDTAPSAPPKSKGGSLLYWIVGIVVGVLLLFGLAACGSIVMKSSKPAKGAKKKKKKQKAKELDD